MEQPTKSKKKTRMTISAIAVALVLCAAPIGSYLFLKSGFTYRLESISQLTPKDLPSNLVSLIDQFAPFEGNARLIHIPGTNETKELDVLFEIDDKIVDRNRFDITSFSEDDTKRRHNINFVDGPEYSGNEQFVLIDTSNVIRGVYPYGEGVGGEIIRHLSVVIPMPEQRSISLNRKTD